jgi:hypothetical protein
VADKYTKRKYLNDLIDTMIFCETQHFFGKSSVKLLSHPLVETRISHTAENRNCAVSLVRKGKEASSVLSIFMLFWRKRNLLTKYI